MVVRFRVDVKDALNGVRASKRQIRQATIQWARKGGALVAAEMIHVIAERASAKQSGQTARSVKFIASGATAVIGPQSRRTKWGVFDPIFLDQPTRPHIIRPRFARALVFARAQGTLGTRGGQRVTVFKFGGRTTTTGVVFAKQVWHPGTKGIFFVDETVNRSRISLERLLAEEVARATQPSSTPNK